MILESWFWEIFDKNVDKGIIKKDIINELNINKNLNPLLIPENKKIEGWNNIKKSLISFSINTKKNNYEIYSVCDKYFNKINHDNYFLVIILILPILYENFMLKLLDKYYMPNDKTKNVLGMIEILWKEYYEFYTTLNIVFFKLNICVMKDITIMVFNINLLKINHIRKECFKYKIINYDNEYQNILKNTLIYDSCENMKDIFEHTINFLDKSNINTINYITKIINIFLKISNKIPIEIIEKILFYSIFHKDILKTYNINKFLFKNNFL